MDTPWYVKAITAFFILLFVGALWAMVTDWRVQKDDCKELGGEWRLPWQCDYNYDDADVVIHNGYSWDGPP